MNDQAQKLREIMMEGGEAPEEIETVLSEDARVITVTSGKGGVGKTSFTVNLALSLAQLGNRVIIVDADLGLANVDVLLGIIPKYSLSHVIKGEKEISEVFVEGPMGIKIISGGSGVLDLVDLNEEQMTKLIQSFKTLNAKADYILIDTGAGINRSVISFIDAVNEVIVVVNPDPTSITDAYAVIKNITDKEKRINLVINRVDSNKEGKEVFRKISTACAKFLGLEIENLGFIYEDASVKKAVKEQTPYIINSPKSLASKSVEMIAYQIDNNVTVQKEATGFNRFINKLFNNLQL